MSQLKGVSWLVVVGIAAVAMVLGGTVGTAQAAQCFGANGPTFSCVEFGDTCNVGNVISCLVTDARPNLEGDCPAGVSASNADVIFIEADDPTFVFGWDRSDRICSFDASVDTIEGGDGRDLIAAGNSNDTIRGRDGHDLLFGEGGSDTIFGNDGNDELYGGNGKDVLNGNAGRDRLDGGGDIDHADGGGGGQDRCDAESEERCELELD